MVGAGPNPPILGTPGALSLGLPYLDAEAEELVADRVEQLLPRCLDPLPLRDDHGLPGMRVLQWGFEPGSYHAPWAAPENAVVYPATHDNDTCVGWWRGLDPDARRRFKAATAGEGKTVASTLVRAACASRARTAIAQLQDLLGLGRATRTNTPGTPTGNWAWRARRADLTASRARRLRELLDATDRIPAS